MQPRRAIVVNYGTQVVDLLLQLEAYPERADLYLLQHVGLHLKQDDTRNLVFLELRSGGEVKPPGKHILCDILRRPGDDPIPGQRNTIASMAMADGVACREPSTAVSRHGSGRQRLA